MKNDGTNILWYAQSAATWNEALPLGNGRIGAMVYGGACHERISLNEDTLWSGKPLYYENPNGAEIFRKSRELALKRKYAETQILLEDEFTSPWSQIYMPLGEIRLDMEHTDEIKNYYRALDLSTGIHTVEYDCGTVHYIRECFVSHPDQVMAMRLTADHPGALTFTMSLMPTMDAMVKQTVASASIAGNCPVINRFYNTESNYAPVDENEKGIGYYAEARLVLRGGRCSRRGGVRVESADSVTIYFNIRTSYNGWDKDPVHDGKPYIEPCTAELDAATAMDYDVLKEVHIADHASLYDRVSLDLGGGDEKFAPTDERLYAHEIGKEDLALYTLYFNFGRYLTIAASREQPN